LLRTGKAWARAQGASMLTIHGTSGYIGRMSKGSQALGVNSAISLS
jgi:hypothetical protein